MFSKDSRYRLELAYQEVSVNVKSILDYGCSDGTFIKAVREKIPEAIIYGFDIDKQKIQVARKKVTEVNFINKYKNNRLPVATSSIEIVTLLDVLEHVSDRERTITEVHRVLEKNGVLLLSVPHKGIAEIFDAGNIKFRFPYLHRFLYAKVFRQKNYKQKYRGRKMVGDITYQKDLWHRHYRMNELESILDGKFSIVKVKYFGIFYPLIAMLNQAIEWKFGRKTAFLDKLLLKDSRTSWGKLSYSVFIKAIKI